MRKIKYPKKYIYRQEKIKYLENIFVRSATIAPQPETNKKGQKRNVTNKCKIVKFVSTSLKRRLYPGTSIQYNFIMVEILAEKYDRKKCLVSNKKAYSCWIAPMVLSSVCFRVSEKKESSQS